MGRVAYRPLAPSGHPAGGARCFKDALPPPRPYLLRNRYRRPTRTSAGEMHHEKAVDELGKRLMLRGACVAYEEIRDALLSRAVACRRIVSASNDRHTLWVSCQEPVRGILSCVQDVRLSGRVNVSTDTPSTSAISFRRRNLYEGGRGILAGNDATFILASSLAGTFDLGKYTLYQCASLPRASITYGTNALQPR